MAYLPNTHTEVNYCLKYCLWLFEKKAYTLKDVTDNFDTDSLSAYFLAGSLVRWLKNIGEDEIADLVGRINRKGDIARQLRRCFGLENSEIKADFPVPDYAFEYHPFDFSCQGCGETAPRTQYGSFSSNHGSYPGSFGSYRSAVSSAYGSNITGSYLTSGLLFGGYGSGYSNIFLAGGSFSAFFSSGAAGSFTIGSFGYGFGFGYGRGSGSISYGSLTGSYSYGRPFGRTASGSFIIDLAGTQITEEEYKRTMINLSSCPMNERGYGIHLI